MLKVFGKIKKFLNNHRNKDSTSDDEVSFSKTSLHKDLKRENTDVSSLVAADQDEIDNLASLKKAKEEEAILSEEEVEEELPSSDESDEELGLTAEEGQFSLFPNPMHIDNTLSVNSTVIPCSYNENLQQSGIVSPSFGSNLSGNHNLIMNSIVSPSNISSRFSNTQNSLNSPLAYNSNINMNKQSILASMCSPNNQLMHATRSSVGTPAMVPPQQDTSPSSLMHHNNQLMNTNINSPMSLQHVHHNNNAGVSPAASTGTEELPSDFNLPPNVNFVCHYCDASFQVRGYLSRHIKKHAIVKEYTCPYYRYNENVKSYIDNEVRSKHYDSREEEMDAIKKAQSIKHVCHNNKGEFWRKDTLVVHLKKKHYRINKDAAQAALETATKKADSSKLPGYCVSCNEQFSNADDFCQRHVLKGVCPALPHGYSIATDLEDEKTRSNSVLKLIKFSNNDARFIFTKSAVVDPEVFSNREVIDLIVDMAEKNTNTINPIASPDNHNITPISSGENSTPIVEKLGDNRIVIHPDAVVPIDINKKRKKRRSKKEMMLARGEITKEQLDSIHSSNVNSPGLQPFVSGSSSSSNESNCYQQNKNATSKIHHNLSQSQSSSIPSMQSTESHIQLMDFEQRKQQHQLLVQLYQQQQQILQQQILQQQQQQLQYQLQQQQHIIHNNNNSTFSQANKASSSLQPVSLEEGEQEFRALDDECEYSNTETNTNICLSGKSSPGSSSTYNVNNSNNANSEKNIFHHNDTYNNHSNANNEYGQQLNDFYGSKMNVNEDDEHELAMDDGY